MLTNHSSVHKPNTLLKLLKSQRQKMTWQNKVVNQLNRNDLHKRKSNGIGNPYKI